MLKSPTKRQIYICFFDCTAKAEFLHKCVLRTIEKDLLGEIDYLKRHDEATRNIVNTIEISDRIAENLIIFILQNRGALLRK